MTYALAAAMLALTVLAILMAASAMLRIGLRRGWRPWACVGAGTAVLIGFAASALWFLGAGNGQVFIRSWRTEFTRSLTASLEVYRQMGWAEAELQRTARMVQLVFADGVIGWLTVAAVGLVFILYLWQRRLGPELPGSKIALRPFANWKLPDHFIWFLLAALAFLLLGSRVSGSWFFIGWNACIVAANAYFLGGLAVMWFYLEKRNVPRVLRLILVLLLGLVPAFMGILTVAGIFDTWWDWRGLHRK